MMSSTTGHETLGGLDVGDLHLALQVVKLTELAVYRLLRRLQGRHIPRLFVSSVFVLSPNLLPFIPSPTSFKDSFSIISLA